MKREMGKEPFVIAEDEASMGKRILIADDDSSLVEMLRSTFAGDGWRVFTAHSGSEALSTAMEESPDVILIDMQLPRINGVEVIARLRREKNDTPAVIMSGVITDATREHVKSLRRIRLLEKPVTIDLLRATLGEVSASDRPVERGYSVIVVDDHKLTRELLTEILTGNGYKVEAVANGKDALAKVRSAHAPFDIALVDIVLPDIAGSDLIKELKTLSPAMLAVAMSGEASRDLVAKCYANGAFNLIAKPFLLDRFLTSINSYEHESDTLKKTVAEEEERKKMPWRRKALHAIGRYLKSKPGSMEYRRMVTAIIMTIALVAGIFAMRMTMSLYAQIDEWQSISQTVNEKIRTIEERLSNQGRIDDGMLRDETKNPGWGH